MSDRLCKVAQMRHPDPNADRQEAILNAAFHAFSIYGYRRVTMDDIARGAGMSRSALYLHYRNKEDIFRSLAARYFEEADRDFAAALTAPDQTAAQALQAAFIAKDGKFMEAVLGTPHGRELLDAGLSVTDDLAAAGEARLEDHLTQWFAGFDRGEDALESRQLAQTLLASLKGLKVTAQGMTHYRAGQAVLARVFALAVA